MLGQDVLEISDLVQALRGNHQDPACVVYRPYAR
jgi:hypothetical protein